MLNQQSATILQPPVTVPHRRIRKRGSRTGQFQGTEQVTQTLFLRDMLVGPPFRIPLWGTVNLWREAFEIWRGSDDKQDPHAMMPARVQEAVLQCTPCGGEVLHVRLNMSRTERPM